MMFEFTTVNKIPTIRIFKPKHLKLIRRAVFTKMFLTRSSDII